MGAAAGCPSHTRVPQRLRPLRTTSSRVTACALHCSRLPGKPACYTPEFTDPLPGPPAPDRLRHQNATPSCATRATPSHALPAAAPSTPPHLTPPHTFTLTPHPHPTFSAQPKPHACLGAQSGVLLPPQDKGGHRQLALQRPVQQRVGKAGGIAHVAQELLTAAGHLAPSLVLAASRQKTPADSARSARSGGRPSRAPTH